MKNGNFTFKNNKEIVESISLIKLSELKIAYELELINEVQKWGSIKD